jgi:hypothetical protein
VRRWRRDHEIGSQEEAGAAQRDAPRPEGQDGDQGGKRAIAPPIHLLSLRRITTTRSEGGQAMKLDLRKKLVLHRETLRALKVKTGIKAGVTKRASPIISKVAG